MGDLKLINRHLIIANELSSHLFEQAAHVNMVFYPAKKVLMMAATEDEIFKGLHKTSMQMLKLKNMQGDKSISLEELLIDQELNDADRILEYHFDAMKILQIFF
jgi:hypothetical protein